MFPAKSRSLPKHLQIQEMLLREIASGRTPDGSKLPPERIMAKELGVAVGTLRNALKRLREDGLLQSVHGSGNYVNAAAEVQGIYGFFRLELNEGTGLPTAEILGVETLNKPANLPFIGEGKRAHRILRLRSLDGVVVALEEIWLDGRFASVINAKALQDSLYYYYKQRLGLIISTVIDEVGVRAVPDWTPAAFGHAPGKPLGYIERLSFDQAGNRAEFSRNWFDHTLCRYVNRLGQRVTS